MHFYKADKSVIGFISANTLGIVPNTQTYRNKIIVPDGAVYVRMSGRIDAELNVYYDNYSQGGLKYCELNALTYLHLENNAHINGFALLKATYEEGSPLTNIRVVGFDYDGNADDVTLLATLANGGYFGINADGSPNNDIIPVIEGTLNVDSPIYEDDANIISKAYGRNLTLNVTGGYYVNFADKEVLRVLLANGVGDGVGVTTKDVEEVTSIGTWFRGNTTIETFDEFEKFIGVQALGSGADSNKGSPFYNCSSLRSIVLPKSVTTIYTQSFAGCTNLNMSLENENITYIQNEVWKNLPNIVGEVYLPNLTTLGTRVSASNFQGTGITKVRSLGKITTLWGHDSSNFGMFYDCKSLTDVVLPETLVSIGGSSFYGCASLRDINFPSNLTNISPRAFYNCTSLEFEDLSLPNLETLGQNAFNGVKIKKLDISKVTSLPNGNNASNYGDKNVLEEIVLSENIESFPLSAFQGYGVLKKINIPESVKSLANYVFVGTIIEGNINLPNLTYIGSRCFDGTNISSFKADILTSIPNQINARGVFQNCLNLKTVFIPNVITIGSRAFQDCTSLEVVDISNATSIGDGAFYKTSSLIGISAPNVTSISTEAFVNSGISFLDAPNVEIISGVANGNGVFQGCTNLKSIAIGKIKSLGESAFRGCPLEIEELSLPNLETLGQNAFYGVKIKKMILGKEGSSLTLPTGSSNTQNFGDKNILEKIELKGVTSIPQNSFQEYKKLTNVILPNSLTTLGGNAFLNCSELSIDASTLPKSITSIGYGCFYKTKLYGEVDLPNLSGTISYGTFNGT